MLPRPVLGSVLFFLAASGTVAGLVPWAISGWRTGPPLLGRVPDRLAGLALLVAALAALVHCFARFAVEGRGTPAPIAPTERLVVSGLYRFVRNPMYLAVLGVILGQALWLGGRELYWYAALVWLTVHVFVVSYEEPTLRRRHGATYAAYQAGVRRWRPRFTPWPGPASDR